MKNYIRSEGGKKISAAIWVLTGIIFAFVLIPPLFAMINKVDPIVIGLPFFGFMELFLSLILSVLLVLLYWIQAIRGEL